MVDLITSGVDVPKNVTLSPTPPSSLGEDPGSPSRGDAAVGAVLRYDLQWTQAENSDNAADYNSILPDGVATSREDSSLFRRETYLYRVAMVDGQFRESA